MAVAEPAATVELHELAARIDVHPLPRSLAIADRLGDQPATDTAMLPVRVYGGIEQEEVDAAVPGDIDKAD